MKIARAKGGGCVCRMSEREKAVVQKILEFYPLIPASYHRLSKKKEAPETNDGQALLEEALAAQKRESKRLLEGLWTKRLRAQLSPAGFVLTLNATEAECFLQIVNEVRVGSWIKAGSPGLAPGWQPPTAVDTLKYLHAMEICGTLQMQLLAALAGQGGE